MTVDPKYEYVNQPNEIAVPIHAQRLSGAVITVGLLGAIAFLVSAMLSSYHGQNLTDTLVLKIDDGWCEPPAEGIGIHCFGDYGLNQTATFTEQTYEGFLPTNTPVVNFLFAIFGATSYNIGMVLYLLAIAAGVVATIWIATKGHDRVTRLSLIVFIGFFNIGVISALDRGNHVGVMVPILFWYLRSIQQSKWRSASLALSLVMSLKFWGFTLLIPLLVYKKWRAAATAVGITVAANHVALGFFPGSYASKIEATLQWLFNRDSVSWLGVYSVSLGALFTRLRCLIEGTSYCDFVSEDLDASNSIPIVRFLIVLSVLGAFSFVGVRLRNRPGIFLAASTLLPVLVLPESGSYNVALVVAGIAVLFVQASDASSGRPVLLSDQTVERRLAVLLTLMLVPVGIYYRGPTPLSGISFGETALRVGYITTPIIAVTCLMTLIWYSIVRKAAPIATTPA